LFGDIVKVTPSSKVVGDMALFLFSKGIKPADVVNLEPGSTPFPESVLDMLEGGLGWPDGGWPEPLWRAVLGEKRFKEAKAKYVAAAAAAKKPKAKSSELRVGKSESNSGKKTASPDLQLSALKKELAEKLKREPSEDELY